MSWERLASAIFLLAAAILAFEVLLLRLFAIEHYHHFAYMAVGIAMLGFGGSGTALALLRHRVLGREPVLFGIFSGLFVVAVLLTPWLAQSVAFEPTQILWDRREAGALVLIFAILTVPFFLGAAALALGLMAGGEERLGRIYGASMVGSGAGAALAVGLLLLLPVERALAATSVVAAAAAVLVLVPGAFVRGGWSRGICWGGVVLLPLLALLAVASPPWEIRVSPFKGLPQVESFAGAQRIGEASGPLGWVVAVEAPAFRHAPGMSLGFRGDLPSQVALFADGSTVGGATPMDGEDPDFLDWLPGSTPFHVSSARTVLVLGAAGGTEVPAALRAGAERVVAVELNPTLLRLQEEVLGRSRDPFHDPRVAVRVGDARAFVARTPERFDVVALAPLGGFGGAAAGVYGAGEDYLNTVEAYRAYLRTLAPEGTFVVSRWIRNPPRDLVKTILTAAQALRAEGVEEVGTSLVLVRSWSVGTLMVKPSGFHAEELARIVDFAGGRMFDLDWPPPDGLPEGVTPAGPFNALEAPVFADAASAVATGAEVARGFAEAYPFDVTPATDNRPYFGRFLRLSALPGLLSEERGSWLPFAEWGTLAVLATLAASTMLALLFTLLPGLWIVLRRRGSSQGPGEGGEREPLLAGAAYFAAIGLAYLLVEIAALQQLVLVLGHPVYAASAVLGTFLVFSGVGSVVSERIPGTRAGWACLVAAMATLVLAVVLTLAGAAMALPGAVRVLFVLLLLAPVATLMGFPFPLGIRLLGGRAGLPWAWSVNGFASVVAVALAAFLAMEVGSRWVLLLGAGFYLAAALVGLTASRPRASEPGNPLPERVG